MRRAVTVVVLLTVAAAAAGAHDMFLRPVRYFVDPNSSTVVRVLNGTFSKSENSIARARLADVSVVSPAGRSKLDTAHWGVKGDTSTFEFKSVESGTYVLGASTKAGFIALKAPDFNAYLKDEGVVDVLNARRKLDELNQPARERYSKHVKALVQVGNVRSGAAALGPLGYPAELVPLANPYALKIGDTLAVRVLVQGRPVGSQLVLYGGRQSSGSVIPAKEVRSDSNGVARIKLGVTGVWYVKFINMQRVTGDTVDYESRWATLTFQLR